MKTNNFKQIHSMIKSGNTLVIYTFNKVDRLTKAKIEDFYTLTKGLEIIVTPIRHNGTINF